MKRLITLLMLAVATAACSDTTGPTPLPLEGQYVLFLQDGVPLTALREPHRLLVTSVLTLNADRSFSLLMIERYGADRLETSLTGTYSRSLTRLTFDFAEPDLTTSGTYMQPGMIRLLNGVWARGTFARSME